MIKSEAENSNHGYSKLFHHVIDEYSARIGAAAIGLYAILLRHANRDGKAWPSNDTVARLAKMSKPTVRQILKDLVTEGLIEICKKGGGRHTTIYRIRTLLGGKNFSPRGKENRLAGGKNFSPRGKEFFPEQEPMNKNHGKRTSSSKPAGSADAAERPAQTSESADLIRQLAAAGLAESIGCKLVTDPALVQAVLPYHKATKDSRKNPPGALRSMLSDPGKWGFIRTPDGWQAPATTARRLTGLAAVEEAERLQRLSDMESTKRHRLVNERAEREEAEKDRVKPGQFRKALEEAEKQARLVEVN